MGIFSWLTGSAKREAEDKARLSKIEASKCAEDLGSGKSFSFSMENFHIAVNFEKQKIIVNAIEMFPWEFAWSEVSKTVTYGGGGMQTVIGGGGGGGSVYVPGQSGSYAKTTKLEIVRLSEQQDKYFRKVKNSDSISHRKLKSNLDLNTLVEGEKVKCVGEVNVIDARNSVINDLVDLVDGIGKWCEAEAHKHYAELAKIKFNDICAKAGFAENSFKKQYPDSYYLYYKSAEGIAIDHSGKVLVMKGTDIWVGSLLGAFAQIVDKTLDVRVDDPTYREQNLTERHFLIFKSHRHEELVEWEERINLLAKNVTPAV